MEKPAMLTGSRFSAAKIRGMRTIDHKFYRQQFPATYSIALECRKDVEFNRFCCMFVT
jgi:hypothetical protein